VCRMFAWVLTCAFPLAATAGTNLVQNPSFEADGDSDGVPDAWRWAGDSRLVDQALTIDRGRGGKRCAKLVCTRLKSGNPAAHAMLCQLDVPVHRGKNYRVSFWARAREISSQVVSIALSDTSEWTNCGLEGSFVPTSEWKPYEFVFCATRDCPKGSRFQLWFHSTGTLWIDDVQFSEAAEGLYRPGEIIAAAGVTNLVPNASFECGADGWGSAEWDRTGHWGGSMNRRFGRLDSEHAFHGKRSFRVALSPENQPVSFFDYYDLYRTPIRAPLLGNHGFMEVEPGSRYTLSVFMKAAEAETPALVAVRQFNGRSFEKGVRVSTDWQRYWMTFTPTDRWCYVLAGPDLRATGRTPGTPERATAWLDAFQLEKAAEPAEFRTRLPIELGLATDKPGNIFDWDAPLAIRLWTSGVPSAEPSRAALELWITDFFEREVWRRSIEIGGAGAEPVTIPPSEQLRGFLRFHAKLVSGDLVCERTIRMAVVPVHQGEDSRFGVNHAYPWPHLLDLCRKAGLVWVRDWSLKWQQVEPEKGRFTFAEPDHQIDRPLGHDLRVLGLLPFPSSHWSSSAPANVKADGRYPESRARVAYAPRDVAEFETYVEQTVAHYKGRIRWWQVFNEPLFTSYALPRKHGYDGATYAEYTEAFARAARRADPQCRILAGIGYLNEGQILDDFNRFFAAGGLDAADAIDIHHYPRLRPPEFIERPLAQLGALMDEHGTRKPIWLTEYGYYADDDPWSVPLPHHGFNQPLESERQQSAYAVRWAAVMLAGGVDKIFYHAGTCDGLNRDSLQGIFFEYGGQPHKIYAAQAVMAHLLTPTCRFVGRLSPGPPTRGYLFRDGRRLVAVVWAPSDVPPQPVRLDSADVELWDIMGRPQPLDRFTPSGTPVYLVADGLSDEQFEAAVR